MLLIVAHHYVVNSGLFALTYNNPTSVNSIFYRIIGAWGKTGINIFVLITGYFMCKSSIYIKKFLKLLLEVEFYNILFGAVFVISGYKDFSIKDLFDVLLPVKSITTNFVGCFLVFYLLIPYINVLIKNISKADHMRLIFILLFVYSGLGMLPQRVTMNYVSWFLVLYLIASYMRMYPSKFTENSSFAYMIFGTSFAFAVMSIVVCAFLGKYFNMQVGYYFVSDSNKILALVTAIGAFLIFKNMKIKNSKWINYIASSTFGVLLIHANSDTMRQWLWKDIVRCEFHYNTRFYALYTIMCICIIFLICVVIDKIRIMTVERWFMKWYSLNEKRIDESILGKLF